MRVSLLVIKLEILDFFYGLWSGKFSKVILDMIIYNFQRAGIGFFLVKSLKFCFSPMVTCGLYILVKVFAKVILDIIARK